MTQTPASNTPASNHVRSSARRLVWPTAMFAASLGLCATLPLFAQPQPAPSGGAETESAPPAPATVRLASGRTFTGFVDTRTDGHTLWLRFEHGRTTLERPIAWSRVVDVQIAGDTYQGDGFRAVAVRFATAEDPQRRIFPAPADRDVSLPRASPLDGPPLGGPPTPDRVRSAVRSLLLDAGLANWDADADDDGLIAYVTPLDANGRPTPAAGTLSIDLIGMTGPRRPTWSATSRGPDEQRPVLETWTVGLSPDDFATVDGAAAVRLPFTRGEPADNPHLRSFGVLRARFAVPGSDLVEAEIDPLRLRPLGKIGTVGR